MRRWAGGRCWSRRSWCCLGMRRRGTAEVVLTTTVWRSARARKMTTDGVLAALPPSRDGSHWGGLGNGDRQDANSGWRLAPETWRLGGQNLAPCPLLGGFRAGKTGQKPTKNRSKLAPDRRKSAPAGGQRLDRDEERGQKDGGQAACARANEIEPQRTQRT